ncbi:hypothetical protein [Actinomadura rudentiformis]|uniref:Uncharacterized protein n=1 Tax=Actinomadura rudentiformis TaxID=359158 RepID=A0A6H9YXH6_9ACTN|nr:hypothetical protein [Actinomadura rudentiformis]KAB2347304.1 hypothetical protein F8566_20030 [Actinomadura rudentiformis]
MPRFFYEVPLFGEPEVVAPPAPKRKTDPLKVKVTWSRYRPTNPAKCTDCMAVHAQTGGKGPHSRIAVWKRKAGEDVALLCYPHAQQRRDEDGLPKLKGGQR